MVEAILCKEKNNHAANRWPINLLNFKACWFIFV